MPRTVVVTGIGAVSCLGIGIDALWDAMLEGRTGLAPIQRFDPSGFTSRLGGELADFSARNFVPKTYRKAVKVMARDIELAVAAANQAVLDANLTTRIDAASDDDLTFRPGRLGCQIGAGLIATDTTELSSALATSLQESDSGPQFSWLRWGSEPGAGPGEGGAMNNLQPLWLLKYLPNMLACHVTILHGAEGPSNTITCGEASGLLSVGEAARVIERGDAEACFAGGAEDKLNLMGMARMHVAQRLADTGLATDDPVQFCRPYAADAPGGLLGEGGAVMILEAEDDARQRGATPHARVSGFGAGQSGLTMSGLARHAGEPGPVNRGLACAIDAALQDAGITADDIDALAPAAMGVAWLDAAERGALSQVFGERLASIPTISTRPFIGECMAGAGALQLAVAARAVRDQTLPARLHGSGDAGPEALGLDVGPAQARSTPLNHVLVCSTSMGGQNAAVVLSRVT